MEDAVREIWMKKIEDLQRTKNWEYVRFLCMEMLYFEPNFIDARKILQSARETILPPTGLVKFFMTFSVILKCLWYLINIKKKHQLLLMTLDELIDVSPKSVIFTRFFAEIMFGFGFYESSIFLVECIEEERRNPADWLLIGESYLGCEDFKSAMDIANKILEVYPDNIRARDLLWKASVEQSINR